MFNCSRNVYQQEAAEDDTIVGRFSIEDAEGRIRVKSTAVYCVGCRIECGWKIVISLLPLLLFPFHFYLF